MSIAYFVMFAFHGLMYKLWPLSFLTLHHCATRGLSMFSEFFKRCLNCHQHIKTSSVLWFFQNVKLSISKHRSTPRNPVIFSQFVHMSCYPVRNQLHNFDGICAFALTLTHFASPDIPRHRRTVFSRVSRESADDARWRSPVLSKTTAR